MVHRHPVAHIQRRRQVVSHDATGGRCSVLVAADADPWRPRPPDLTVDDGVVNDAAVAGSRQGDTVEVVEAAK